MERDKVLHFAVGALICALIAMLSGHWLVGVVTAHAAGWFKERYDLAHPDVHTYDGWDAWATTSGALAFVVAFGLLVHAFHAQVPGWAAGLVR